MTILRTHHNQKNPFVMLNRTPLEEKGLSWAAKGLWAYIMSRPESWNMSVTHLVKNFKTTQRGMGEKAVYALIKELIDFGYCIRLQDRNGKGEYIKHEYVMLEKKELKEILPLAVERDPVELDPVKGATNKQRVKEIKKEEQQQREKNVVVLPDKEEKEKLLSPYQIPRKYLIPLLEFSLERIQFAIAAYEQYKLKCLRAGDKIDSEIAVITKAIKESWKPTKTKKDREKQKEIEQEYLNDKIKDSKKDIESMIQGINFEKKCIVGITENTISLKSPDSVQVFAIGMESTMCALENFIKKWSKK